MHYNRPAGLVAWVAPSRPVRFTPRYLSSGCRLPQRCSRLSNASDDGGPLHVRNERPDGMTQFSGEKTPLYVHGASQAASSYLRFAFEATCKYTSPPT